MYTLYGKSVTGTFEGYVSDVLNIYNAGTWTNISTTGLDSATNNSSYYTVALGKMARTNATVNLTNYNYLKIQAKPSGANSGGMGFRIGVSTSSSITDTSSSSFTKAVDAKSSLTSPAYYTGILDISSLSGGYYIYVGYGYADTDNAVVLKTLDVNKIYVSKT